MKEHLRKLIRLMLAVASLNAVAVTRYVDLNSPSPTPPYTSWPTAATNIQDAIDAALDGDSVLVTNGVYQTGGRVVYGTLTNRVAVTKPVDVRTVNGPQFTIIHGWQLPVTINGDGAIRCVYLTNGATLSGFTLTNGSTQLSGDPEREQSGAGIWCDSPSIVVSNCLIVGNSAAYWGGGVYSGTLLGCVLSNNSGGYYIGSGGGGGAYSAILNGCVVRSNLTGGAGGGVGNCSLSNCALEANRSWRTAGGASLSTLDNCTLTGNSAGSSGGGVLGSTLDKCVLIGNHADTSGGGAYGSTLNNCVLIGNSAYDGAGGLNGTFNNCILATNGGWFGGGASRATLNNCLLIGNTAGYGGGTDGGSLNNCTLVANQASQAGGGTRYGKLRNCIAYFNVSPTGSNYFSGALNVSYLTNCCTAPLPPQASGILNFTSVPKFIDQIAGNYRLQSNSPCIGTGNNNYISLGNDLDGRPRIVGGTVDVGAYEYQSVGFGEFIEWLQISGLPTDGTADFTDADSDGMSNYGEWRSDTIPTNALSVLRMVNASSSPTGANITWESVPTRSYWLERATNLGVASAFQTIATNIAGQADATIYTDTTATNGGPYFYRVGVQ